MEDTVTILAAGSGGPGGIGVDTLLLILTSAGFTAIVTSVITAVVNRRKLKADTTEVISQAAGSIVERLEAENIRVAADRDKAWAKVADLELAIEKDREEREQLREQIILARDYERETLKLLEEHGIVPPPNPPKVILP